MNIDLSLELKDLQRKVAEADKTFYEHGRSMAVDFIKKLEPFNPAVTRGFLDQFTIEKNGLATPSTTYVAERVFDAPDQHLKEECLKSKETSTKVQSITPNPLPFPYTNEKDLKYVQTKFANFETQTRSNNAVELRHASLLPSRYNYVGVRITRSYVKHKNGKREYYNLVSSMPVDFVDTTAKYYTSLLKTINNNGNTVYFIYFTKTLNPDGSAVPGHLLFCGKHNYDVVESQTASKRTLGLSSRINMACGTAKNVHKHRIWHFSTAINQTRLQGFDWIAMDKNLDNFSVFYKDPTSRDRFAIELPKIFIKA